MPDIRLPADEDRERVRERILAAFAGVPMPADAQILADESSGDEIGEQKIRRELAGRRWEELSDDFLKRRWQSFVYLGPNAFVYYLPAILATALDEKGGDLYLPAVYLLTPSAYAVYTEGSDSRFDSRISDFSDEQQAAVVEFLSLPVRADEPDFLSFRAARAFWLGWDVEDMPEGEPIRDFFRAMHHFDYPEPSDPAAADLVQEIRDAFDNAPYPGEGNICVLPENAIEPAEFALEFDGLDWRAIHPALLAQNFGSLTYFTDEAFRYFLPAYLIADLTNLGIPSAADTVLQLTSGLSRLESELEPERQAVPVNKVLSGLAPKEDWREALANQDEENSEMDAFTMAAERMAGFSIPERNAIIHYLQYRAELDEDSAAEINSALEEYWIPSLDQPDPADQLSGQ